MGIFATCFFGSSTRWRSKRPLYEPDTIGNPLSGGHVLPRCNPGLEDTSGVAGEVSQPGQDDESNNICNETWMRVATFTPQHMLQEMRDAMIMESSPAIITVVTYDGKVIHQNRLSKLYFGDRVANRVGVGEDVLALVFSLEPEKGARMLDELSRAGSAGLWKAVVRVPYSLADEPHSSKIGSPIVGDDSADQDLDSVNVVGHADCSKEGHVHHSPHALTTSPEVVDANGDASCLGESASSKPVIGGDGNWMYASQGSSRALTVQTSTAVPVPSSSTTTATATATATLAAAAATWVATPESYGSHRSIDVMSGHGGGGRGRGAPAPLSRTRSSLPRSLAGLFSPLSTAATAPVQAPERTSASFYDPLATSTFATFNNAPSQRNPATSTSLSTRTLSTLPHATVADLPARDGSASNRHPPRRTISCYAPVLSRALGSSTGFVSPQGSNGPATPTASSRALTFAMSLGTAPMAAQQPNPAPSAAGTPRAVRGISIGSRPFNASASTTCALPRNQHRPALDSLDGDRSIQATAGFGGAARSPSLSLSPFFERALSEANRVGGYRSLDLRPGGGRSPQLSWQGTSSATGDVGQETRALPSAGRMGQPAAYARSAIYAIEAPSVQAPEAAVVADVTALSIAGLKLASSPFPAAYGIPADDLTPAPPPSAPAAAAAAAQNETPLANARPVRGGDLQSPFIAPDDTHFSQSSVANTLDVARTSTTVTGVQAASAAEPLPPLFTSGRPAAPSVVSPSAALVSPVVGVSCSGKEGEAARASRPTPPGEPESWHEVWATMARDPVTGNDVIVLTQMDVTAKVVAERHLALVMETEHRLVEQLFPRHILQYITEEWTAGDGPIGASGPGACWDDNRPRNNSSLNPAGSLRWRPVVRDCNALATCHPEVTLLFADIRGFTPMCKEVEPRQVMGLLNALYSRYDAMLDKYGVYKVETIGDCYFVAGGLIHEDEDGMAAVREGANTEDPLQAEKVFMFAKAMLAAAREVLMPTNGQPVEIRIGLHTGPVVSGVVGTRMPRFCLFGDTVNTASRMESTGMPGAIHASEATYRRLARSDHDWEPTGGIEVKGKGHMQTYLWRAPPAEELHRESSALRARLSGVNGSLTVSMQLAVVEPQEQQSVAPALGSPAHGRPLQLPRGAGRAAPSSFDGFQTDSQGE